MVKVPQVLSTCWWKLIDLIPHALVRRWPLNRYLVVNEDLEEQLLSVKCGKDWIEDRRTGVWFRGTDSVQ
jgi:hypothetical protein